MKERSCASRLGLDARVPALALLLVALSGPHAAAQPAAAPLSADKATAIATDAYIYGYPLVTVETTRRVVTNVATPVRTRDAGQSDVGPAQHLRQAIQSAAGTVDSSIDMKTPVRDQVNALDIDAYFNLMAQLMKDNPPTAEDSPMVEKMSKIGVVPGQRFDLSKLSPDAQNALKAVPKAAFGKIMGYFKDAGKHENGWAFFTKTGVYGTDYLDRAFITAIGLGANRPQDAVYPTSELDAEGKPYSGGSKYIMHFDKGKLPPVNGFWSLTMYDAEYFFVDNPLNRYTLSARNELKKNADGSVDLFVQNENPGKDKESNWPPAPADKFVLMLRMYWPTESPPSLLDGTWTIPGVKQAS